MKKLTIRYICTIVAALSMLSFTACESGEGLGEDVEEAGEAVEETAEEAQ